MKRFLLIVIKIGICFFLFLVNLRFSLNHVRTSSKEKIVDESPLFFRVAVVTPQGAELFLIRDELEEFLKTQKEYSYLIPAGQELIVQEQLQASYNQRYKGESPPSIKVERIDAGRQLIELYMSGDRRDTALWYEATDKKIVPKYQMMFSVIDVLPYFFLCIVSVLIEYKLGKWIIQKFRNKPVA